MPNYEITHTAIIHAKDENEAKHVYFELWLIRHFTELDVEATELEG